MANTIALASKIKGMAGKRLRAADYHALMQMETVGQIAAYLCKHPGYQGLLAERDTQDVRRGVLESALSLSLLRQYGGIFPFLSFLDKELLNILILQLEMQEILAFLRFIKAGRFDNLPAPFPPEIARRIHLHFEELLHARNEAQLVAAARDSMFYPILTQFLSENTERFTFTAIEQSMQALYYSRLYRRIRSPLYKQSAAALKQFFGLQLDLINISRAVRLRRYFSGNPDDVFGHIIPITHKITPDFLRAVAAAQSDEQMWALLEGSPYGKVYKGRSYDSIDHYTREALCQYNRRILRASPPSFLHALAYLRLKENEVKNLIAITECVKYRLPPQKTAAHLAGVAEYF